MPTGLSERPPGWKTGHRQRLASLIEEIEPVHHALNRFGHRLLGIREAHEPGGRSVDEGQPPGRILDRDPVARLERGGGDVLTRGIEVRRGQPAMPGQGRLAPGAGSRLDHLRPPSSSYPDMRYPPR